MYRVGPGWSFTMCNLPFAKSPPPFLPLMQIVPQNRVLSRLFTPKIAAFYEQFYAGKGVTMVRGLSSSLCVVEWGLKSAERGYNVSA